MKKIISLFQRDRTQPNTQVSDEVTPGAEWVINGEGVATRKWDGTCCMVRDGKLYKRYDAKHGKAPPANFEPAQEPDPLTGHWPGWIPVGDEPESKWHREAWENSKDELVADWTFECCGPKLQGNPEKLDKHVLIPHGIDELDDCPRDYEGLKQYLCTANIEGIVWHHPDGRMVKIKTKDFGIKRGEA